MAQAAFEGNIYLIGFMGAGKSTVSACFSEKYGMTRVEMDQMIVDRQGISIPEIFEQYGESHFRDLESALLRELGRSAQNVVSCGGGVVVRAENIDCMKKTGRVVLLTASPETILERVKDNTDRPILNGHMNVEFISELMEKRREMYLAAADLVIATDGKSAEEICGEILAKLAE
ncbi:MAG: shikimate kinase [Lachnospiraceae bacterium]|nr:shikimate kinase [Lachnospiraceae bacterium]